MEIPVCSCYTAILLFEFNETVALITICDRAANTGWVVRKIQRKASGYFCGQEEVQRLLSIEKKVSADNGCNTALI